MLRSKSGIVYAETLAERDGEAYTYAIESTAGVDIRKSLFFALAEKGWAMIGLEPVGMSIEDIFISIVDQSSERKNKYEKRKTRSKAVTRNSREISVADEIVKKNSEEK